MQRLTVAGLLALPLVVLAPLGATAQAATNTNAQRALQWLQCTQQQPNGQIGSGGNPIARSSEVALGLAAAGQDAAAMRQGTASLADFLKTAVSTDVGTNGDLLLARASQPDAGPTAAVATELQAAKGTNGEYGADIFSDALAILGLRAAGQPVGTDAVQFLKGQQKADGGWSADNADQFGTDSNTTALVIQALLSAGLAPNDATISSGFGYLLSVFGQGGFGSGPGAGPDPNSDELVIMTIIAANRQADATWASMLNQALQYLADQQIVSGSDAGAISSPFSRLFATTEAPAAFLLRPFTVKGVAESKTALLACPAAAASPTPTVTAQPTASAPPRLAQTGRPLDARPLLASLALLTFGLLLLWRSPQRARKS